MANQPINRGIKNSWSLLAFAKSHGKMQIGEFTNGQSGDSFKSCIFTDPNDQTKRCFVAFSSKFGREGLTPSEIKSQKDSLQVVELNPDENGNTHYVLCNQGANAWEDVDLF